MMLLRNFDIAVKYFDYSSNLEIENYSTPRIGGWYKYIDGQISALFVKDNKLYFQYAAKKYLIDKSYSVAINKINNTVCEFNLFNGNIVLEKFKYSLPTPFMNLPPFDFINTTDQDWGLFIANIINEDERKQNYIQNLMEE